MSGIPDWMFADWPIIVLTLALLISLVTGKTFNPIRGMNPAFVSRTDQPKRYWSGVAILAAILVFSVWVIIPRAAP